MIKQLKHFLISMTLLLAAILLPLSVFAQQSHDRTIKKISWRNEPIKITQIKVDGAVVDFDKNFQAKNDWLRSLTLSVSNTSDKAICYINIALDFPRTKGQQPPARDHLLWGRFRVLPDANELTENSKILKPGESIDLTFSDEEYRQTQDFLRQTNYSESIDLLEIIIDEIGFEGERDTLWISGQMMRRDPSNSRRWLPIRSENQ